MTRRTHTSTPHLAWTAGRRGDAIATRGCRRARAVVLAAAVAAASCGDAPLTVAPDASPDVAFAQPPRPLTPAHGAMVGSLVRTRISETELLYRLDNTAVGPVSQLGLARADWVVPAVLFDPARRQLVVRNPEWGSTLTAANGDRIQARYTFRAPAVPFSITGDFVATLDLVVDGGTGRFVGATGSAVAVVRGNVFTERYSVTFAGEGILTGND